MEDNARFVAVKTLCEIEENKAYSNIKLSQNFRKYDLNHIDRSFATEILYGTLRWKLKIDYILQKFSKMPLNKVSNWGLSTLRTAVYQIFYMDKVPDFAVVNQAVDIVKIKEKNAGAFVNAVLRNILRNKDEYENIDIKDKIKQMSIKYSHPEWYIRYFLKQFSEEFVMELMIKNNTPPEMIIRVNTLKCSQDELIDLLSEKGIKVTKGEVKDALIVSGLSMIEKSEEYLNGLFQIQDQSSMLSSIILNPAPLDTVFDMCSAPGGKATHIAQIMHNNGEIAAFDIHSHKLKLINENAKRLGINIISAKLKDSTIYDESLESSADKVLVDAPCSGLGLIRKKPEIKWNVKPDDLNNLSKIQTDILFNSSKYVKHGGSIVYSTCTITREENEDVVDCFIKENKNFELQNICSDIPEKFVTDTCSDGYIKLFSNIHNTDGFFIAKFRRK